MGALIVTAIFDAAFAASGIGLVVAFAINMVITLVAAKLLMHQPTSSSSGSRVQLPPATNNIVNKVYGNAWVRGTTTYAAISTDQKQMWYVLALSEVSSITSGYGSETYTFGEILWSDRTLIFGDSGDPSKVTEWVDKDGLVQTAVSGKINVYLYPNGSNSSTYSGQPTAIQVLQNSAIPSVAQWTSTDLMSNYAFAIVRLTYDTTVGITQLDNMTFNLKNSNSQPGSVFYDYMTNEIYGCGIPSNQIDVTSLSNLDAYSAVQQPIIPTVQDGYFVSGTQYTIRYLGTTNWNTVSTTTASVWHVGDIFTATGASSGGDGLAQGGTAAINRYEINGPVDISKDSMTNLLELSQCCDSFVTYNEMTGLWQVIPNAGYDESYGTITGQTINQLFQLTDNNIIGPVNLTPIALDSTFNAIEVHYNEHLVFDADDYVYIDLPTGDLNPNEPRNQLQLNLNQVTNSVQATIIGTRKLAQSRDDLVISVTTDFSGLQIQSGDVVAITNANYAWVKKPFRVMQTLINKDEKGLTVQLKLQEYDSQIYTITTIAQYRPVPNTGISNPTSAITPAAPTVTNQLPADSVPQFTINAVIPDQGVYSGLEIWYSSATNSSDQSQYQILTTLTPPVGTTFTPGSTQSYVVTQLPASNTYYFEARVITPAGSRSLFSSPSSVLNWVPIVSPSALLLQFTPGLVTIPIPYGSTTVSGVSYPVQMQGINGSTAVPFTTATTDGDMPDQSYRVLSINYSGITLSSDTPVSGTYGPQWTITGATYSATTPSTLTVVIRYKDVNGDLFTELSQSLQVLCVQQGQQGPAGNNGNDGIDGQSAPLVATTQIYQWSTTTPSLPTGSSVYQFRPPALLSYSGADGWSINPGTNPGIPGDNLWQAQISLIAPFGTSTRTFGWSTATLLNVSQNGAAGTNGANGFNRYIVQVYQAAITIPSSPTGSGTLYWNPLSFSAPSGWTTTPPSSLSPGFSVWQAAVTVSDVATATSTSFNWNTASITPVGYAGTNGTNGTNGSNGSNGQQGASARTAYAVTSVSTPSTTPTSQTVNGDNPPNTGTWFGSESWSYLPPTSLSAGQYQYQTDGIYNPATNQTIWVGPPYQSALKVGSLSAITTNTGGLTVSDHIQAGTAAISGNTMTGSGMVVNSDGTFAVGNPSTNIAYSGGNLVLNGTVVGTNNVQLGAITQIVSTSVASPNYVLNWNNNSSVWPDNTRSIVLSATITPAVSGSTMLIQASGGFYTPTHQTNVLELWKIVNGVYTRLFYMGSGSNVFDLSDQGYASHVDGENTESLIVVDNGNAVGVAITYLFIWGNNSHATLYAAYPSMIITEQKR